MNLDIVALLVGAAAVMAALNMSAKPSVPVPAKLAFVHRFGPVALAAVRRNGWPLIVAPVLVAWAAMESDYGTSELSTKAFNLFGVKAGPTWLAEHRPYITLTTREYEGTPQVVTIQANFRRFVSYTDSLDDLLKMLSITTIYKPAYDALTRGDYAGFLQAINASGFSTASNYAGRIKNFVNELSSIA